MRRPLLAAVELVVLCQTAELHACKIMCKDRETTDAVPQ